jgi:hypothetical protein
MLALCLAWLTVVWADATLGAALANTGAQHRVASVATVSATQDRHSSDLHESERLELLTTQQRGFGRDQAGVFPSVPGRHELRPSGEVRRAHQDGDSPHRHRHGEQVGRFANPPPAVRLG